MNYAVEPSEAVGMSARRLERIRPAMQTYIDRGVYAGISTLIARRGKVVQAGAFAAPDNAQRLAAKLRSEGYTQVFVRDDLIAGRKLYRVRIGPIPDVPQFDRIVAALEQEGVRDAHLALD